MNLFPFSINSKDKIFIKQIRKITGLKPSNHLLYKMAVTHKAIGHKILFGNIKENNERLEFLGDAVLDLIVADLIFKKYPLKDEGFLTNMRSKIVSRDQLNYISKKIGLLEILEIETRVLNYNHNLGGNALEALVGAIYLDKGFKKTYKFIKYRIIERFIDIEQLVEAEISYKGKMYEYAQKNKKKLEFKILDSFKKGKDSYHHIQVLLDDQILSDAVNLSKKKAEEIACEKAYLKILEEGKNLE